MGNRLAAGEFFLVIFILSCTTGVENLGDLCTPFFHGRLCRFVKIQVVLINKASKNFMTLQCTALSLIR